MGLKIAFFGSSLVSAYWNGAATYYRGIIRALDERGHRVTFYEPDAFDRQKHRDMEDPIWATVVVYGDPERALERARGADLVIKASGVGVHDRLLEQAVPQLGPMCAFWDVDAPATLDRVRADLRDPFAGLIPQYDLIFTYGGGEPVVSAYRDLGARQCVPIYNALDPTTHHPVPSEPRFACDLAFLGNRLPDREARVQEFFFRAAELSPSERFLFGGSGWGDRRMPSNTRYLDHVYTRDHNALNVSARTVLNVSRDSMARYGFSPATRVFEAAGAGACLITDAWEGIEMFLEPGEEILVARDGEEVAEHVARTTQERAHQIGAAALERVLAEHTYAHRAAEFEQVLAARSAAAGAAR